MQPPVSSQDDHPIKRILYSRKPSMVLLKYVLVIALVALGLARLKVGIESLRPPQVYRKDFLQEYLLAKAVLNHADPYLPLPELAAQLIGPLPYLIHPHPTPHPPPVAILSLPLGLLDYEKAAIVWFLFELACIFGSVYLLLRWLKVRAILALTVLAALLAMAWGPIQDGLILGQLMTCMLILLIGAWLALRGGHAIWGGIFLGCAVALKLIVWPIIILLALKKNWRAVGAAGAVAAVANLAAALLMGFDRVAYYYLKVGAFVSTFYRTYEGNFSLWTISWRIFQGTSSPIFISLEAPPLVAAPAAAQSLSFLLPLILLVAGLILASQTRSLDAAFGVLICVSILVSPVAWGHYLVMAIIPIVIAGRYLFALDLPKRETYVAAVIGVLLFIPHLDLVSFISLFAMGKTARGDIMVPFAAASLSFIPAVATLGLLWFVWHLDRKCSTGAL